MTQRGEFVLLIRTTAVPLIRRSTTRPCCDNWTNPKEGWPPPIPSLRLSCHVRSIWIPDAVVTLSSWGEFVEYLFTLTNNYLNILHILLHFIWKRLQVCRVQEPGGCRPGFPVSRICNLISVICIYQAKKCVFRHTRGNKHNNAYLFLPVNQNVLTYMRPTWCPKHI